MLFLQCRARKSLMDLFITRTKQTHRLTGDALVQFQQRPDWILVEEYIRGVLEVTQPTINPVTFNLPR